MLHISSVRHSYPENAGFYIDREKGHGDFTFLHFYNSVEILLDGKLIKTEPHSVILYDRTTPQYYRSEGTLLHDWFHFDGSEEEMELRIIQMNQIYYPNHCQYITETVAELEREFMGNRLHANRLLDFKLKELFIKLERDIAGNENEPVEPEYIQTFRCLRGEVFSTMEREWSVSEMAKKVNLSESHFHMLYKKIYGTTPTADLIHAKMNSAKNMLLYDNKRIDDIALALGYKNTTHFIRQFKGMIGRTPTEYRKMKILKLNDDTTF